LEQRSQLRDTQRRNFAVRLRHAGFLERLRTDCLAHDRHNYLHFFAFRNVYAECAYFPALQKTGRAQVIHNRGKCAARLPDIRHRPGANGTRPIGSSRLDGRRRLDSLTMLKAATRSTQSKSPGLASAVLTAARKILLREGVDALT